MVKISVIIPVYNIEKYLRECLDSVLAQTLKEIEIICIDDGSTDHSYEFLLDYKEKNRNVIVLHQEHERPGLARNKGMEQAVGKYFCFMDADDYYIHDKALEHLFIAAEENQAWVCGGNMVLVSDTKTSFRNWFFEDKKIAFKDYGDNGGFTRYIFRSEIIKKNNINFPKYRKYEDPPFLLNVMVHTQKFYAVNDLIYAYRKGHKKTKYSLGEAIDLLKGIRDCFLIAQKNNLVVTYKGYLKDILINYGTAFWKYALEDQKEIWVLIHEINRISNEWMKEFPDFLTNLDNLVKYIAELREEKENLLNKCSKAHNVIIYGAGEAGKFFLKNYGDRCAHISGFAVSRIALSEKFVEGYPVKEITEYDRGSFIIVSISKKYREDIQKYIDKMEFKNVCYIKYEELKILEEL